MQQAIQTKHAKGADAAREKQNLYATKLRAECVQMTKCTWNTIEVQRTNIDNCRYGIWTLDAVADPCKGTDIVYTMTRSRQLDIR